MKIGKLGENALKRSVLKQIKTEFGKDISAAVGSDCAFSDNKKIFTAMAPVTLGIPDAGYFAAIKAVNSLRAQGVCPDHLTLEILLPPECEEQDLKRIVAGTVLACKGEGVPYAGGHTQVSSALRRPVVTAYCAGSAADNGEFLGDKRPLSGRDIVVAGPVALEGTAILASEKYKELTERYPAPFIDNAVAFREHLSVRDIMDILADYKNIAVHDISSSGVFGALWEFAERGSAGLLADLKAIPLMQESVEICEFFRINPYQLLSGGSLLIATGDGERLVQDLLNKGIRSALIGTFTDGRDRVLKNSDETRFLDKPGADEILSVLE